LIEEEIEKQLSDRADGIDLLPAPADAQLFQLSGCVEVSELNNLDRFIVRKGQKYCDSSGALLAEVLDVSSQRDGRIYLSNPGDNNYSCSTGSTCIFRWKDGRRFYIEQIKQNEDGENLALIRFR